MFLFRGGAKGKDLTSIKYVSAGVGLIPSLGEAWVRGGAALRCRGRSCLLAAPAAGDAPMPSARSAGAWQRSSCNRSWREPRGGVC